MACIVCIGEVPGVTQATPAAIDVPVFLVLFPSVNI